VIPLSELSLLSLSLSLSSSVCFCSRLWSSHLAISRLFSSTILIFSSLSTLISLISRSSVALCLILLSVSTHRIRYHLPLTLSLSHGIYPGYGEKVKYPMCLGEVRSKILAKDYGNYEELRSAFNSSSCCSRCLSEFLVCLYFVSLFVSVSLCSSHFAFSIL